MMKVNREMYAELWWCCVPLQESLMHFPTWIDLKGQDSVPETVHHVVSPPALGRGLWQTDRASHHCTASLPHSCASLCRVLCVRACVRACVCVCVCLLRKKGQVNLKFVFHIPVLLLFLVLCLL